MATPTDAVRALHALHTRKAETIARAPTGIEPGFDAATGITWTEDGRARYRTTPTGGGGAAYMIRYVCNTALSVPTGTDTIVNFNSGDINDGATVTTGASWAYTVVADGYYFVSARIGWQSVNWGAADPTILKLFFNGSFTSDLDHQEHAQGGSARRTLGGSDLVACEIGDTLDIRAYQDIGSTVTLSGSTADNYVIIWKL